MINISIDTNGLNSFLTEDEINSFQERVSDVHHSMTNRTGRGAEFLGWLDLPSNISTELISNINETSGDLRRNSEAVFVIGIGGSYLGARAVFEALTPYFQSQENGNPSILYAGNNISEDYLAELISMLGSKDYSIIVISKSGTTTEPAIAFRILKEHIENKYGKVGAKSRIVSITDKEKGALKKLSDEEGYKTFIIPDDVGGRFSVLTPVGLLPVAAAGIDIDELLKGAADMEKILNDDQEIDKNISNLYAVMRNLLYEKGKGIEIMVSYTPKMQYFIEWWKQLYGESEGKGGEGIFPAGVIYTTDLHSMGQMVQDGVRNIFETVFNIENESSSLTIPEDPKDLDGLNYIAGKRLSEVNRKAMEGTMMAHLDGGVPNIVINVPELSPYYIGQLIYFFERACAVSAYLLGVNPFDQPGVEAYKNIMFDLLGKPST
jgi:glucose-6-phosphate isomerase